MANDKRFVVKNGLQSQNIAFVDSDKSNTITANMLSSDTLSFEGQVGQLFSIADSMGGTIFSVNDISGIPSIEVDDDGEIRLAETFGHVLIGTDSSTDTSKHIVQITGGLNADSATIDGTITTAGAIVAGGDLTVGGGNVFTDTSSQRVKYSTYSNSFSYGMGMQSNITYGGLNNDWAVTFQMNADNDRGFWFGDTDHNQAQGAMALTTEGKLTVAHSARIGYGETDTTIPGATHALDVSGSVNATAFHGDGSNLTGISSGGLDSAGVKTVVFAAGEDLRFGNGTASDGLHIESQANRRNFIYGEDSIRVSQLTGGAFKFILSAPSGAGGNTLEIDTNTTGGHQRINAAETTLPLDIQHGGTTKASISANAVTLTTGVDLIFEGATGDANETTLTVTDPTADRTITFPDNTGSVPVKLYTDITTSGNSATNLTISNSVPNTSTSAQTHLRWVVHDITFSSGPNNPILTVATSGASVTWTGAYYNSTLNSKASFSSTDLFTGFGSNYSPRSFTLDMYQTDTNDWLVNLTSDDYNGVYFLQAHATSFVPYSITVSSGSGNNVTGLTGSLTEEFGVIS